MVSDLFFSELVLVGLLWLWVMLHYAWPSRGVAARDVALPRAAVATAAEAIRERLRGESWDGTDAACPPPYKKGLMRF